MAAHEPRPIVLALSNPTSKCECTPEDVASATDGRGLVADRKPVPDIDWKDRTLVASQCNNLYVFPGVGLGALVAKAPKVTHEMFLAASRALSEMVTPEQEARGYLLPPMSDIRAVSRTVAKAVAIEAREAGLGRLIDDDVRGDHRPGAVGTDVRAVQARERRRLDSASRPGFGTRRRRDP